MDWLLLLPLLCLICMAAMVPMMLLGRGGCTPGFFMHGRSGSDGPPETARQVLDRRYAGGEITEERYQKMRAEVDTRGVAE